MTTTTLPTARLRLADEGLGPIVEKFLAETGRTISTKCALRYAIRGLRGIKLETLKVAGKRLTSGDAVRRFIAATQDVEPQPRAACIDEQAADQVLAAFGLGRRPKESAR